MESYKQIMKIGLYEKQLYWLLLCAIGIWFYCLNIQTPFMHDDYSYCFYYAEDSYTIRPTDIRVSNVPQMFESMWHHYLCVNGRFTPHLLLQSFCVFLGKDLFNLCNTIIFMVFLHMMVLLNQCKYSIVVLLLSFLYCLYLIPFPGQTLLWMAGSLNYLWPLCLTLIYLYWAFNYTKGKETWYYHFLCFILCLCIGWTNESISAPVSLGLFIYYISNRTKFRGYTRSSFIGYALGATLIVFGPGTFSRLSSGNEIETNLNAIQFTFIHVFNVIYKYVELILPFGALLLISLHCLLRKRSNFRIKNIYLILFFSFSLFLLALGMEEDRIYFGISILSYIIIIAASEHAILFINQHKSVFVIIAVALCVFPIKNSLYAANEYNTFDKAITQEIINGDRKCVLKEQEINIHNRFVFATNLIPSRLGHNRLKSFFFYKEYIQSLPEPLYNFVTKEHNQNSLHPVLIGGIEFFEIDGLNNWLYKTNKYNLSFRYIYPKTEDVLSLKQHIIRYLFNTLTQKPKIVNSYFVEDKHGNTYYVLPKEPVEYIQILNNER